MLITKHTRKQFDQLLLQISQSDMMVVDTETNGLDLWGNDIVVGLAIYLPKFDTSYYIAVAHGVGQLTSLTDEDVDSLKWSNRNKKLVLTQSIYNEFYRTKAQADNIPASWLDELRKMWVIPDTILMHNAQFDLTALHMLDFPNPKTCLDTMLGAHVLYSDWSASQFLMPDTNVTQYGNRQLKWLARLFKLDSAKEGKDDLTTNIANLSDSLRLHDRHTIALDTMSSLWMLPASEVAIYAESDVRLTYGLAQALEPLLKEYGVIDAYYLLCDIQYYALWRMHRTGFNIDMDSAGDMVGNGLITMHRLEQECLAIANISISSPIQIRRYLKSIGIDVLKADEEVITTHKDSVPLLRLVAEYRDASKMVNTYLAKWLDTAARTKTGRIHPSFKLTTVKTYRSSSSDDYVGNLQNIPRDTHKGISPKSVLLPISPEHHLVEIDYSTLELRVGAWVCETLIGQGRDMTLTNLIVDGIDMHAYSRDRIGVSEILLGGKPVTPDNVTEYLLGKGVKISDFNSDDALLDYFLVKVARFYAKTLNFASFYGAGGRAISKLLNVSYNQAVDMVNGWKQAYPAVPLAMEALRKQALTYRKLPGSEKQAMYVQYPLFNLMRRYDLYNTQVATKSGGYYNPRDSEARNTLNSVVQGTSGVICTNSAMTIAKKYPNDDLLALQASVHDSIILSIKPENMYILHDVASIMCDYPVYPALSVDIEIAPIGRAWGYKTHVDLSAIPTKEDEPYELPTA